MTRYRLAAQPHARSDLAATVRKPDMKLVLAQSDPLLTSTYATLLLDAARGCNGPFTASEVLDKMAAVKTDPGPSLRTVEAALARLQALGVVTLELLN